MRKAETFTILLFLILCLFTDRARAQDSDRVKAAIDTTLLKVDSSMSDGPILDDSLPGNNRKDSLISEKNDSSPPGITDSATRQKKVKEPFERQFRVMLDIFNPINNIFAPGQYTYEVAADHNISKDAFLVMEIGNGGGKVDLPNLRYSSNNTFVKLGVEKSFFDPMYKGDWDMLVIGARYGIGFGQRGATSFTIPNPFGGTTTGEAPAKSFVSHWGEVLMGLRFELLPRVYMGWNFRMRFNFTPGIFDGQAAPRHLAGFGQADRSTTFGFNYYIGYAIRWNKKMRADNL